MSKYTTELRFICEELADLHSSVGYNNIKTTIEKSRPKIFDFDYPIFDTNYKGVLETKILKHFYTREIGYETYGIWKLKLDTKLNEIMPYYNQLYKSELIEFNPLYDVDVTESYDGNKNGNINNTTNSTTNENTNNELNKTGTQKNEGEKTNTGTQTNAGERKNTGTQGNNETLVQTGSQTVSGTNAHTSTNWDLYSDTPQGGINGIEGNGAINNMNYLTNARKITNTSNDTDNHTTTNNLTDTTNATRTDNLKEEISNTRTDDLVENNSITRTDNLKEQSVYTKANEFDSSFEENNTSMENYTKHIVGKHSGSDYSELLLKFRKTFLNIDMMIINDLSELFFNLW